MGLHRVFSHPRGMARGVVCHKQRRSRLLLPVEVVGYHILQVRVGYMLWLLKARRRSRFSSVPFTIIKP